jgi:hypothetical protein
MNINADVSGILVINTNDYILEKIKVFVWSGFYSPQDVDQMISDLLEKDADEEMLRSAVEPEFKKKAIAESGWPLVTDCDQLDFAFEELNSNGVVALQNAGYTQSDGIEDSFQVIRERGRDHCRGYCFYHGQDLERVVNGEGLWIAFGDLDQNDTVKTAVGTLVKEAVESFGFKVEWNGNPERRLQIPKFDWKRRVHPKRRNKNGAGPKRGHYRG